MIIIIFMGMSDERQRLSNTPLRREKNDTYQD